VILSVTPQRHNESSRSPPPDFFLAPVQSVFSVDHSALLDIPCAQTLSLFFRIACEKEPLIAFFFLAKSFVF